MNGNELRELAAVAEEHPTWSRDSCLIEVGRRVERTRNPEGIDVERLARALAFAEINCWANPMSGHKITDADDGTVAHRRDAEAIAAEYARQRKGER